jgi:uncharacterized membrane protein
MTGFERVRLRHPIKMTLSRRDYIPLFLFTAAAFVLRIINISKQDLWLDEIISFYISKNSIPAIMKTLKEFTSSPPLHHFIMHLFLAFGSGAAYMRLPSVLFGTLIVPLGFYVADKLFDKSTAYFYGGFLLLSSFQIYYSQEARMYSLFAFLSLGAIYFFYKAVLPGGNNKAYLPMSLLFNGLDLLTHYFAAFLILFQMVFLLYFSIKTHLNRRLDRLPCNHKRMIISYGLMVAVYGIFLIFTMNSHSDPEWAKNNPALFSLTYWKVLLLGFSSGNQSWFVFLSLFIVGALSLGRRDYDLAIYLLLILFGTCTTVPLFLYHRSTFQLRYYIFVQPIFLLLTSSGASTFCRSVKERRDHSLAHRAFAPLALALIVSFIMAFSYNEISRYYQNGSFDQFSKRYDTKMLTDAIEAFAQNDSIAIIGFPNWAIVPISYYSHKANIVLCDILSKESADFYSRFIGRRVRYLNVFSKNSTDEATKQFESIALYFRKSDETDNAMKVADTIAGTSHLEGRFDTPDFAVAIYRFQRQS